MKTTLRITSACCAFFVLFASGSMLRAQASGQAVEDVVLVAPLGEEGLPDAPGYGVSSSLQPVSPFAAYQQKATATGTPGKPNAAKHFALSIRPGLTADKWTAKDKFEAAFVKQATLGTVFSSAFSAGIQHLNNGRPHYGTDSGAYGERLGANLLRQTSQSVFNVGLFSSVLRTDPRYYVMGPEKPFKSRAVYAASRVFITRRDNGGNAPNIALFAGVLSSQLLANTYYPDQDRSISRSFRNLGTSLATRIGTQELKEFGGDIRQHIPFLKHRQRN